ncbi:cystathionine beta-lyase [candidate division KSB3 bacterium]|uniref:Cystathionine beta-lyase n=1 Tax=candidate division KSB3 bacterium TaxID=2044937 RepID=A0A2G6E703_9BACT|nr:MAG: cystathionine beta-lyase [candidate division KSB3 bacterium]PIE30296.1 MAG: cystathionine beta-lyase [candidate division KSB3 bacterium]
MDEKRLSQILNELGEEAFAFNPVSVPIYETSNFVFDSFQELKYALEHEAAVHLYTRGRNPTVEVVEKKLAALEGGEKAKLFASGVAAIAAAVTAFLQSGDHVVCVKDCYPWTKMLFTRYLKRFQVDVSFVDGQDPTEWEQALRPETKLFYLESPTTFSFQLQDLRAVAQIAREHQITSVIDNSWATPYLQNPIEHGIDLVVHSCSKYLGGHSDVVAGVVVGSEADIAHIFQTEFLNIGAIPGPFESWLLLRGLRTLAVRMRQHQQNSTEILEFLQKHPRIEAIFYPFHRKHAQYELACRQMRGGSSLFSVQLTTRDIAAIERFTNALKHFKRAVSWGGYESLVLPFAVTRATDPERISVVRMHIGLEDPALLIEDLAQALDQI